MTPFRALYTASIPLLICVLIGGCPQSGNPTEFIAGDTGDPVTLGATASVTVLAPVSDFSIAGGTPVEVVWRAIATSRFSVVNIIFDADQNPDNGNEIEVITGLSISESSVLLDTTALDAGDYFVGVVLEEIGEIRASGYAPGLITINERPELFFTSPRDNFAFDRTEKLTPRFNVAWQVDDPDSIVTVRIFLDPDTTANGNEVLLRESNSQSGDSFDFDLPTAAFDPGEYRLLALVSDGVDTFSFYAPGSIRLRSRLAGFIDLRDLSIPEGGLSGAVFEGFNPRDNAGSFVSSTKDVDGDGFDDFIMLAQFGKPFYDTNIQRTGVGEAYFIYGRANRFSGRINLNSTGTLFRGEVFAGVPEVSDPIRPSRGITSFAVLSDWDRDGLREFAFGLPFTDSLSVARLTDINAPLDASGYFRSGAVVIASASCLRPDLAFPGRSVINLGTIGTVAHETCDIGDQDCAEGFYGPKAPTVAFIRGIGQEIDQGRGTSFHRHLVCPGAATPNFGGARFGCRFSSNDFNDQFGETVSAWDFDSIIMSVPNRDPGIASTDALAQDLSIPGAGVISVYFCDVKAGFYPWTDENGPGVNNEIGYPGIPIAGHVNVVPHGGPYHYIIDDLRQFPTVVGPRQGSPGYWVDIDDSQPCNPQIAGGIDTPDYSVRFWSNQAGARLSNAKGVNDFNADGLLDMVIGAPFIEDGAGACFLVLGRLRDLVRSGEMQVEELALPMDSSDPPSRRVFDGIRVLGSPGTRLGQSQDSAGDFNGDGVADVVIGSPLVNSRRGGATVLFGSRDIINLTQGEILVDDIAPRRLGVTFVGEDEGDLAGARVTGCGDIDGDGNDDIIIAAPNRSIQLDTDLDGTLEIDRNECGVVYLIYGSPDLRGTLNLSEVGSEALPGAVFIGPDSARYLGAGIGLQGDRSTGIAGAGDVDGDGRDDLLFGAVTASPRDRQEAGEVYLLYGTGD